MLPTTSSSLTQRRRMPWASAGTSAPSWARKRPRVVAVVGLATLLLFYLLASRAPAERAPEDWEPELEDRFKPPPPPVQPVGANKPQPKLSSAERQLWHGRAKRVRDAFLHAYHGYEKYATWPEDELKPLGNRGERNFNAWGVTVVDSISTMVLMDTKPELERAIEKVASMEFKQISNSHVPFFETVIRYLGGLLSAYALTNNTVFLARADDLGRKLLPVFNTKSGIPAYSVNTENGGIQDSGGRWGRSLIAEIGSCQLEYKYLAHLTGRKEYFRKVEHVMDLMAKGQQKNGLWHTEWSTDDGVQTNNHFSVAAEADSAYEYLLKQYLLSGKTEPRYLDMYLKSVNGVINNLLFLSPERKILYLSDLDASRFTGKFEHLACFFPGLLALGVEMLDETELPPEDRQMHLWAAEGLGHSCWLMYADQASGLGPELAGFRAWPEDWRKGRWMAHVDEWRRVGSPGGKPPGVGNLAPPVKNGANKDYDIRVGSYLSRPETMESMYVLWRVTGDKVWREHGWQMWEAIEAKTKTDSGFASVWGVESANPGKTDSQPRRAFYFLAETVKYAYLLSIDPAEDPWPSSHWIFNTEAHPLPVFKWKEWERDPFEIPN
ncbi:seven-hairpin glycosidase [Auricularia subglabra TFB-10046 SS5]|uniref:alpha-1,2-Mannosidase n=1 Tax=Auricularia subglabra (strain TFB-10046 / SS5) TaxID=717982 RepID=J0WRY6_AURST|nr:seven-hairpin glycosidase [Auricularia subglabra TFB-10046 SS5]